jgi:hypothetical protein
MPYSWDEVHDPKTVNSIIFLPAGGVVGLDKWGQVASGYVLFFVFGTGSDAYSSYKKMGVAMGLGRVWPALHILRESGAATPNSFISARSWTQSWSSKAKSKFWSRSGSVAEETLFGSVRHGSVAIAEGSHGKNRKGSVVGMAELETHKTDISPGASARVWAAESSSAQDCGDGGVRVFRDVHLEYHQLDEQAKDRKSEDVCAF